MMLPTQANQKSEIRNPKFPRSQPMNQVSRPVSDISTGHWTPTPIYPQVNGSLGGGEVSSDPAVNGDVFEVKLAPLAWPEKWRDEDPQQTLSVIQGRTEIGDLPVTVALLQQGRV